MSQTQHTALDKSKMAQPVQLILRVQPTLKWKLREIAARKQATVTDLATLILEEYVAREKAAA